MIHIQKKEFLDGNLLLQHSCRLQDSSGLWGSHRIKQEWYCIGPPPTHAAAAISQSQSTKPRSLRDFEHGVLSQWPN